MSGTTILRIDLRLRPPVDEDVARYLHLFSSSDTNFFDDDETELALPDHPFWQSSPYFLLEGRLTYDGICVRVDAEVKNRHHVLEYFLLWLSPHIESAENGIWEDADDLDDQPIPLAFVPGERKFVFRALSGDRDMTPMIWTSRVN